MNAGRGGGGIDPRVQEVEIFDGERVRRLSRGKCRFRYRWSIFQDRPDWVMLSATLKLDHCNPEAVSEAVKARMQFTRRTQDALLPNAGSVFKTGMVLGEQLKGFKVGGAMFSAKTANWILNHANGTSEDVLFLIEIAKRTHRDNGLPEPELEWIIW